MFTFFSALLIVALFTFGAVQSHALLFIEILWFLGIAVLLAKDVYQAGRIRLSILGYLALCVAAFLTAERLALPLLAAGWGWLATERSPGKSLSFLHLLIVVGVFESALGLIQYFVAPGWIFGYQNPFYISSGTLINRNHFAGLLEMIVPATIAFAFAAIVRGRDTARGYFYLFLGAFIGIAIVFSTSRMGLFSCLLTILCLGGALRLKSANKRSTALALGILGLVVAGALWIGVDIILQRFSDLGGEDAWLKDGRVVVYVDTARMIASHPFGVGVGNYRDVFRQYQTYRPELLMDHAHNDYLETAAEWGMVPAIGFWLLIFLLFGRAVRSFLRTQSVERTTVLLASMGAIFSILLHSLVDFNLQIPSNAMLFFAFVGIAAQASSTRPFTKAQEGEAA